MNGTMFREILFVALVATVLGNGFVMVGPEATARLTQGEAAAVPAADSPAGLAP